MIHDENCIKASYNKYEINNIYMRMMRYRFNDIKYIQVERMIKCNINHSKDIYLCIIILEVIIYNL